MKKKFLMCGIALLAVALILGGMFWMKEQYYSLARKNEALGRYEMAAQEYEQAGRYKDAEAKMAEMTELAEIARTELLKLFPIPGLEDNHHAFIKYVPTDKGAELTLNTLPNISPDADFQWGGLASVRDVDEEYMVEFMEENMVVWIVSFDTNTGEYMFVQLSARGRSPLDGNCDGEILLRGKLDGTGTLVLNMEDGTQTQFKPVGYENYTTGERRRIEN